MKNLHEKEIQQIEESQMCNKREIGYYLAAVNSLYNETYNRIWGYIETATLNHDIKEIKKYLKTATQLTQIKEVIWVCESVLIKYDEINYFPQFKSLKQQNIKLINL